MADNALALETHIEASPETVWRFLADPERIVRWMGTMAEFEARAGAPFRINVNGRDIGAGEVVAVEERRRLVLTWGWEGNDGVPPGSTTIEITLQPDGDGTHLRLEHRDLPSPAVDQHIDGWTHYLDRLAIAAPGGDPGRDPMLDAPSM